MKKVSLIIILLTSLVSSVNAEKAKEVHGTYKLNLSENRNITIADAERMCEEQAKLSALKDKFGTDLVESTMKEVIQNDDEAQSYFHQHIEEFVKGEWLKTTKPSKFTYTCENNNFFITCEVWGEAIDKEKFHTNLTWKILANKADIKSAKTTFNNGEKMYIYVKSPLAGYIAVFLQDAKGVTQCLLPYWDDKELVFNIERKKEYYLFDRDNNRKLYRLDYELQTEYEVEVYKIILFFSKNVFALPFMKPKQNYISENFEDWLIRIYDPSSMELFKEDIKIINKDKKTNAY